MTAYRRWRIQSLQTKTGKKNLIILAGKFYHKFATWVNFDHFFATIIINIGNNDFREFNLSKISHSCGGSDKNNLSYQHSLGDGPELNLNYNVVATPQPGRTRWLR